MEYGNYARQRQRKRRRHRTFIRIMQADKCWDGGRDGRRNGCAVEAAGNQLSKKGQQNANVNDRWEAERKGERREKRRGVEGGRHYAAAICKCCTLIAKGNIEYVNTMWIEYYVYIKNLFKVVQFAKHQKLNMQIEERKRTLPEHAHIHTYTYIHL